MNRYFTPTNRNAIIRTREDRVGKLRTETARRDDNSVLFAVSTSPRSHATNLFIDYADGDTLRLSGAEARTLYRLLRKHYKFAGKAR
jgi:hypothetical protein